MQSASGILGTGLSPYILCLVVGILISLAVLQLQLRYAKISGSTGILYALTGIPLGIAGAKLFYALARFGFLHGIYGVEGLFRLRVGEFAFTGAILGVLGAAWLTARLTRQKARAVIDAVAPAGMLLIALARFSEYYTDFGAGAYIYETALHFFPFAVPNVYGEWYAAIFMLEGLVALAGFILLSAKKFPGHISKGDTALLLFALTQVLLESLRSETIKWGFVRVQQLSSVAIAAAILVKYGLRLKQNGYPTKRLLVQAGVYFACIVLCVGVEFALDKTEIPRYISYLAMMAALSAMGLITFAHMNRAGVGQGKCAGECL